MWSLMSIRGDQPLFLIHQSYQYRRRLLECFMSSQASAPHVQLGVVASLPLFGPDTQDQFLSEFNDLTDIRLIDPEIHLHPAFTGRAPMDRHQSYSYLTNDLPTGRDDDWIDSILVLQETLGATHVMNPALPLGTANPDRDLAFQFDIIRSAQDQSDMPFIVSFTLMYPWLTDPQLRTRLLNEIVDLNADTLYVRVKWPELRPRYGQPTNAPLLEGYRELAAVCFDEGKKLILPTSGLTGWLITALGATGYSIGPSYPQQAYAYSPIIRRTKGGDSTPRRARYFSETLLHVIEADYHRALISTKGYAICGCRFCEDLDFTGRTPWNHELSALHYIQALALLTEKISNRRPRETAGSIVRGAMQFMENLSPPIRPVGENLPRHLAAWAQILR